MLVGMAPPPPPLCLGKGFLISTEMAGSQRSRSPLEKAPMQPLRSGDWEEREKKKKWWNSLRRLWRKWQAEKRGMDGWRNGAAATAPLNLPPAAMPPVPVALPKGQACSIDSKNFKLLQFFLRLPPPLIPSITSSGELQAVKQQGILHAVVLKAMSDIARYCPEDHSSQDPSHLTSYEMQEKLTSF